jgi:vitamin K-dependent gamma-carboxylase
MKLFRPVDNSPLIVFRIILGFLLFYHCTSFLISGAVYNDYIQPPFTFTYIGFEFLQPLPGNGMYAYFMIMALLGLMIMLGAWYPFSMISFSVLWTVIYLMQQSDYNNHYYLILLLCWTMVFMPAHRYASVDVRRNPLIETISCPQYCIWIFVVQVSVVYFFAGISKLCPEWLSGKFISICFNWVGTHHFFGRIYRYQPVQLLICYGGILADLFIVPLLLWKRTRKYAFLFSCLFHLFNSYVFNIGIFPYLCIALNLFFFDPKDIKRFFFKNRPAFINFNNDTVVDDPLRQKMIGSVFLIFVLFQLIIPMRSWLFPGDVYWTNEGYRMSWKMMMRTKNGTVYFKVIDTATHCIWKVEPAKLFTPMHMMWLATSPDIIWQYAQRIKKEYAQKGFPDVQVYAIGQVSLNRSVPKPMIDTTVDLSAVKWEPLRHAKWITDY